MALIGIRAHTLILEVITLVQPHLPAGVRIELVPHRKWTTLAGNSGGGYGTTIRGITSPRFLPRRTRAGLTAKHAVETVLEFAYRAPGMSGSGTEQDFEVRAAVNDEVVFVSYRPPGAGERIQLPPIPLHLL